MTADRWTVEVPSDEPGERTDADYWERAERAIEACRRWERERDEARAERDAALAALARVEALHPRDDDGDCIGCGVDAYGEPWAWPCATIRAVAGDGQEAGD